jgi:transcription antitermination protein NusB
LRTSRHSARRLVMNALYVKQTTDSSFTVSDEELIALREPTGNTHADMHHAKEILKVIDIHLKEIMALIASNLHNWELERLAILDRIILVMGCAEILYLNIPPVVVINEAIELAKEFSSETAPSFINGILDSIYHQKIKELPDE